MERRHLNEEMIQDFVINQRDDVRIQTHLNQCPQCKRQVLAYQKVMGALNEDPGYLLSEKFVEKVMKKISPPKLFSLFFINKESYYFIAGFCIILGVLFFLVDMKPIFNSFTNISFPDITSQFSAFSPLKEWIAKLNGSLIMVPLAGLVFLAMYVFDHFIFQRKFPKP